MARKQIFYCPHCDKHVHPKSTLDRVRDYLKLKSFGTARSISKFLQVEENTARNWLLRMHSLGEIKRVKMKCSGQKHGGFSNVYYYFYEEYEGLQEEIYADFTHYINHGRKNNFD